MDKKNLSKMKYVYKIYSSDNIVHCERYPIVYINNVYVYCKVARQSHLAMIDVKSVRDCCDGLSDLRIGYYGLSTDYFFKVVDFDSYMFTKEIFKKQINDKLEKARRDVKDTMERYEKAKSELEKLEANEM